jgi:hypothetical protein
LAQFVSLDSSHLSISLGQVLAGTFAAGLAVAARTLPNVEPNCKRLRMGTVARPAAGIFIGPAIFRKGMRESRLQ